LTVFGRYDSAEIARIASEVLGMPLLSGEKVVLSADKFCYTLRKKPRFDAAFGVATKQKEGRRGNGDAHSVIRIDEKRFLAVLSDGMGSGEGAARISASVLSLLESFYRAGMPRKTVLSTVNKLLTFHREESFACLDVAAVDLNSGMAEIVKIGSPLAFIFSQGNLRVLEGDSLPLGMLDEIHPTVFSVTLRADDVLLFLSDGVTDAFGSTADLLDYLKKKTPLNPQALADDVLSAALCRTNGVAKDDMTALAVRLFPANP
jgi:stage II sporulation protein E